LDREWRQVKPVVNALAQMARKTGDRTRDVDQALVNRLVDWISPHAELADQCRYLVDVVPIARQEEQTLFGESLPSGITLHGAD
jgi:hypothetical protein